MINDKHLYNEDSIESLSPLEFTRLRPQVYAGDCTYSTQLLVEIISNAIDEYRLGHGDKISVTIDKEDTDKIKKTLYTGQEVISMIDKEHFTGEQGEIAYSQMLPYIIM